MVDAGAKTWYFITVDYTFGKNIQRDTTAMIEAAGGKPPSRSSLVRESSARLAA
jgi:hypothetical protein